MVVMMGEGWLSLQAFLLLPWKDDDVQDVLDAMGQIQ
jgi:hypothetical protein